MCMGVGVCVCLGVSVCVNVCIPLHLEMSLEHSPVNCHLWKVSLKSLAPDSRLHNRPQLPLSSDWHCLCAIHSACPTKV